MKKSLVVMFITVALLAACGGGDGDGVPIINDPHHPVDTGGKPISGTEFLKKYCVGKSNNETCAKVNLASNIDAAKGGLPKGW